MRSPTVTAMVLAPEKVRSYLHRQRCMSEIERFSIVLGLTIPIMDILKLL